MPDLPTRLDLYSIGRAYVRQRAKKLDPNVIDTEGSDANLIIGGSSAMGQAVVNQLGYGISRLFMESCFDDDLDRWMQDRYGGMLPRKGASPARGEVQFTRTSIVNGAGDIPIGTRVSTLTGIEYITTQVATFGASSTSAKARVRAVQAGKSQQVGENTIGKFSLPQLIFDPLISVNNSAATAGGEDKETDDQYKERGRKFWKNARRGTVGAIEQGALAVPGVTSAMAIEALDGGGRPARVINLFIADSTGVASDALAADVMVELEEWRAGGITVLIFTSAPLIVDIVYKLAFVANTDTATLSDIIRAATVELVNSGPVNGTLSVGSLYSLLQRYVDDGLIMSKDSIVSPTGDLVPAVGQTIKTTLANVSVTI